MMLQLKRFSYLFIGGMATGLLLFIGLATYRAVTSGEFDDSNITNWLRMVAHLILHPGDFAFAWYAKRVTLYDKEGKLQIVRVATRRVGWYVNKDELSDVVDVRPRPEEKL